MSLCFAGVFMGKKTYVTNKNSLVDNKVNIKVCLYL